MSDNENAGQEELLSAMQKPSTDTGLGRGEAAARIALRLLTGVKMPGVPGRGEDTSSDLTTTETFIADQPTVQQEGDVPAAEANAPMEEIGEGGSIVDQPIAEQKVEDVSIAETPGSVVDPGNSEQPSAAEASSDTSQTAGEVAATDVAAFKEKLDKAAQAAAAADISAFKKKLDDTAHTVGTITNSIEERLKENSIDMPDWLKQTMPNDQEEAELGASWDESSTPRKVEEVSTAKTLLEQDSTYQRTIDTILGEIKLILTKYTGLSIRDIDERIGVAQESVMADYQTLLDAYKRVGEASVGRAEYRAAEIQTLKALVDILTQRVSFISKPDEPAA